MLGYAIADRLFARQPFALLRSLRTEVLARQWHRKSITEISGVAVAVGPLGPSCRRISSGRVLANQRAPLFETRRALANRPYDIDTNLPKDVILYKYDNPKYFRWVNFFAISQLLFWSYVASYVYTYATELPVGKGFAEDTPWYARIDLGEPLHRTIMTSVVFLVGYGIFVLLWTYILKSVRYLVLRKGGNELTFVTYTPFGGNRLRTVPLDKMTCRQSRAVAQNYIPIKVKGDLMHYLVDMRGEFRNPKLFDFTAGLKRSI